MKIAAVVILLLPSLASAGPLLRAAGAPRSAGAIASEQPVALDAGRLAELRGRQQDTVDGFPLGADGVATLSLHRIEPFTSTLRIEVDGPNGVTTMAPPDATYFGGSVVGEARSLAFLAATPDGVHGFVVRGDATYAFGPDGTGGLRSYALRDVDPAQVPAPSEFCANDLHPERSFTIPAPRATMATPHAAASNTMLEAQVAIDTDVELINKLGSPNAAASYLTSLFAAANVIYERDVKVHLKLNYMRLRSGTDPWTASDTGSALDELQTYWIAPGNAMPNSSNDIVHLVSAKGPSGGVAYIAATCDSTYHFGVSQVNGAFNVSNPGGIWDVLVFTHELGHNVGSVHTHCYNPPLDHCYSGEQGCYSGSTSLPAGGGTIMSYCHLLSGGLSNVDLIFGDTVSSTIRSFVEGASCLSVAQICGDGVPGPGEQCDDGNTTNGDGCSSNCETETPCGDGTVGAGEQCDDGNTTPGDGCDAACQLETVCGNGVLEGVEQCDDGNTISGDGCSYKCRLESTCGNGTIEGIEQCDDGNTVGGDGCSAACRHEQCGNHYLDVGEGCDDGNTVSGDGCSSTCVHEPLCGDGSVDPNEECDDGNTSSGDGCDASCRIEPCQIVIPHQAQWAPARLIATPGAFGIRARFGVPSDALDLEQVAAAGVHVMIDGATGTRNLDATVPGGGSWAISATRAKYRDAAGSASGVRSIVIRARGGGVSTVDLKIQAHGGPVPDANDAPPTVTVLLGDATAGQLGACGRFQFNGARCVKRGKKLTCR